ncbi:aldo/keto reductase [Nonomuraea sp. NPDC049655]|uniref:aldo/keto reductase n=1 Tax=Nonomuraea sp. NPDC049655 TaxID=3364355 RepID=UPI00378BE56A
MREGLSGNRFAEQPVRRCPRLAVGTMILGAETSEPDSHAITDRAHEHGIDFFDTADVYADGRTEQIIDRRFAQGDGRRDSTLTRLDELFPPPGPQRLQIRTRSVRLVTSSFSPCDA